MATTPACFAHGPVRWGILGCGDVTEVKSGPALQQANGSALVAVMRRDGAKAADFARRHGVPRWYDDAEALITDPEVDAVYIATPPDTHAAFAVRVAAAGKPALVEKPMARHTAECDAMVAAFAAAAQPLFVAYYRRALPRFLEVQRLLADDAIGPLTSVHLRFTAPPRTAGSDGRLPWRLQAPSAGGGLFLDLGSHAIDLLDFLLGPLAGVAGHASQRCSPGDVEDTVAMAFCTGAGVPGTAAWNFAGHQSEDRLELTGPRGRIQCSVFGDEPVRLVTARGVEELSRPNPPPVHQPLVQTIVDELLGRGTCPSTGTSARRTSAVMDRVLSAYYGGRDDAFWSRPESWPGRRRA
jgi:1,5-anhydro-D-fructose reductase (1,5-anhydro-D-mannitol-forming)